MSSVNAIVLNISISIFINTIISFSFVLFEPLSARIDDQVDFEMIKYTEKVFFLIDVSRLGSFYFEFRYHFRTHNRNGIDLWIGNQNAALLLKYVFCFHKYGVEREKKPHDKTNKEITILREMHMTFNGWLSK